MAPIGPNPSPFVSVVSMTSTLPYVSQHPAQSSWVMLRGLRHHVLTWGDVSRATPEAPVLVMVHGWMDCAASFQFMVDALRGQPGWADRPIVALDWRGFGLTETPVGDSYFFADYLGDLDTLIDHFSPDHPVDLLGHSMGGNVVMLYAGVRSKRIRKLVNLEGFGMPAADPEEAPDRYAKWLDELKKPMVLKDYASQAEVAQRLRGNNPFLTEDRALWLAGHWAREVQTPHGARWVINADAAHKRSQPILYRVEEVMAFLKRIHCPVLFVEGAQTLYFMFFNGKFGRDEFVERVKSVPSFEISTIDQAGHMLHHDQPEELARRLAPFLS
jgi:pimeloyl-ACP methyl ester carboxylesterase